MQAFISDTALISTGNTCVDNKTPPIFLDSMSNISNNPKFVNANAVDGSDNTLRSTDDGFAIQENSPCIDMAAEAFTLATDVVNTACPQLNGYYIGAYESLAAEPE